ncbi:MAG: hypothetical protein K6G24_05530 [Lachnospiraceae bacterium]|nr:hypothetical protein [Lachnospiraceae bacterium]
MYLMHKDVKVAEIRLRDHRPLGVLKVIEPEHLPIGLGTDIDTADMNLPSWHSRRAIPYGRVNSEKLFKMFGNSEELACNRCCAYGSADLPRGIFYAL